VRDRPGRIQFSESFEYHAKNSTGALLVAARTGPGRIRP
jgi:hypothetical protein